MYCVFLRIDGGPPPRADWRAKVKGELIPRARLAKYTTYRLGGPARYLLVPADAADIKTAFASGEPVFVMGGGSNLLVADAGYEGTVIKIYNTLDYCSVSGGEVVVGAGRSLASLVDAMSDMGISGMEWAAGIPGAVGGAVCSNAGAFGAAIWDRVATVTVITPTAEEVRFTPAEVRVGYREVHFPVPRPFAVTEVELRLAPSEVEVVKKLTASYLAQRRATQPGPVGSAGCVFKNPPHGEPAGALIDRAGLKGLARGGARVSTVHANFIVNEGGATAAEVYELIKEVQRRVYEIFGVSLSLEIVLVGDFGDATGGTER